MPTAYKVLGQSAPAANTATSLYTVPSATSVIVSTIAVCNRGSSNSTFQIAVRPDGAALANQHYLAFNVAIAATDTITFTLGITMDAADIIHVLGSTADLSFSAFGTEIT